MRKVFWDNPYQCTLMTRVAQVEGDKILFDETIAFSFSGGQESDKAFVNKLEIIDSECVGKLIYYTLPKGHGFCVGDNVCMQIDWQRRYRLMRLHFAAEIILELISTKLNSEKIGAHISEAKARIDFRYEQNISHVFGDIIKDYNEIIAKDLPIYKGFSDVESQRRYWEIEGFSKVLCGGTHVRSTAEVGLISLKRINIGSEKERVEIKLMATNERQDNKKGA